MEQCDDDKVKDIFVSFFKDVNPETIDTLYKNYGPYNPQTSMACCYMKCIVSISCWDEEGIKESYRYVKSTYRMLLKLQTGYQTFGTPVEKLLLKVLSGEALMLLALMKMAIKRCMKHYIKAGLNLRSAWRMFNTVQLKIVELCDRAGVNSTTLASQTDTHADAHTDTEESEEHQDKKFWEEFDFVEDIQSFFNSGDWCLPAIHEIKQLKVISQFGYGLFHLILSLIPPTILRIVNMLGFEGNRYLGLSSLKSVSSSSDNYRAILASIVLLWYNLHLKPAFFSDLHYITSGIHQSESLLLKLGPEFEGTWLDSFFTGRIAKLQRQYEPALEKFQTTAVKAAHLKECKLLAYYEIGWCHMIMWNWTQASEMFLDLMEEARWSKGFYGYLGAVCIGSGGGSGPMCRGILRDLPSRIKKTVNIELDSYCARKSQALYASQHLEYECRISALEMMYIWRCLYLTEEQARGIVDAVTNRPLDLSPSTLAASYLLTGMAWLALSSPVRAEQAFSIADTITQPSTKDSYISVCTLCELAELYHSQGKVEESQRAATRALAEFGGYDLENRLFNRVKSLQI